MVLRNIVPEDLPMIEEIYLNSFPPEERRPFADLVGRASDPTSPLTLTVIEHDMSVAGMMSWWDFGTFRYIEHFAIDSRLRSHGLGHKAITEFISRNITPVVIEVEPRETGEMASRRIGFYRRSGFEVIEDYDYIQPPYSPQLPEVRLTLMTTDRAKLEPEVIADVLHRKVYGKH